VCPAHAALEHEQLDRPAFGKLEKPRVGQRDRIPTATETEAILDKASPQFRLIYLALRQCGARPGEMCRATIADVDRTANAIVLMTSISTISSRTRAPPRSSPGGLPGAGGRSWAPWRKRAPETPWKSIAAINTAR